METETEPRPPASPGKAPAITRAAAILRLLAKTDRPMGLQEIARELGLVPSTSLYVLRALVEEEFVAFDAATKRYTLAAGVLSLARQWLRRDPFHNLAQPELDRLSATFDVTALGVQISGLDHIVAVAVSQAGGNFRLSTQVGSRFPALISATGRCIAAFGHYSQDRLKARFEKLRWDNPPSFSEWLEQVEEVRRLGYAVDNGQYIAGVTVLTAPIRRGGDRPTHALVAFGLSGNLQRSGIDALAKALRQSAATIAGALEVGV
jgi:DNA-binding IclR family transcriptional regulator